MVYERYEEAGAHPSTELLVGDEGAATPCPYCDTVVPLARAHVCPECGAEFDVKIRWRRS